MKKTLIKIFTYSYLYIYRDESEQGFLTTINSNCISLNGAITARIFQIISSLARREHSKGWLRNREFGPKSNRHDTPPTFPIDLRPEVLPPSSSTLSLSRSLESSREGKSGFRANVSRPPPTSLSTVHPSLAFPVGNLPFTPSRENGGANEASSTSVRHLRDETIEERARSSS